ncbi:hypothetical protein BGZ98_000009 [Dissophora globulifera]|nr:hypothetical protein BGZ98_000009 [Dissophora globulifera]
MKFIFFIAQLILSATVIQAASTGSPVGRLFFTQPLRGTVWTAGHNQTIKWTNVCKPGNPSNLEIILYMRPNDTIQVPVPGIGSLGELNCSRPGHVTVLLPASIPFAIATTVVVTVTATTATSTPPPALAVQNLIGENGAGLTRASGSSVALLAVAIGYMFM